MVRRSFLVSLLFLANPWLFEVEVQAQKDQSRPTPCSQLGVINVTKTSERNETCGTLVNYTNIIVCENDGWREMCDEDFNKLDAQVICRQLGNSTVGAGAGRLSLGVGAFASNFFPVCNGQESSITDCTRIDRSGACNSNKIIVTCFVDDPVSGPLYRNSSTAAVPITTTSELPADTSVVPLPHTKLTSTGFTDSTNHGNDSVTSILSTNIGISESLAIIIAVYTAVLFLLMAIIILLFAVIKCKCKHSSVCYKKHDPADVKESVLHSELMDVSIEQSQHKNSPVYETILSKSEDTARVPATDVCPAVDLKDNAAYETSPMGLKENIAYETHLNPVNLQENIAYETSKRITTQTNEVYGVLTTTNTQNTIN